MSSYGTGVYGRGPYRGTHLRYAVPASQTEEGKKHERDYYEALGRFVQLYAEVEQVAAQTLWMYAGTTQAVSKIIFSGTRVAQGSTWIKQIAEATDVPKEKRDDLENVLQQLSIINGVRDEILHYGAQNIAEGRAVISSAWKAKSEPKEFPISPTSITLMTNDLRKIIAHFAYRHLPRKWPISQAPRLLLQQTLDRPWQYKHHALLQELTKEKARLQRCRLRLVQLLRLRASRG